MADYLTTDTELTSVANAIRTKGGTSASLVYPAGFVSAIEAIPTGGGGTDVSDTTAVAGDVLAGKYFHIADGTKVQGTIASKTSSDVTTSSNVVTIPAGHYASQVQKTVGTAQAAQTIHPSTTDQTIASGKYLTGTQTVKGVLLTNLTAGNIKKDVVVKIGDSTDDDCVTSVTGTYESGTTPTGTISITQNGTYDVTNYASANVNVSGGGMSIKRIAGNGSTTVYPTGWGASDFGTSVPGESDVIDANNPKFLIAHVTIDNVVRSFAAVRMDLTSIYFSGSHTISGLAAGLNVSITQTSGYINSMTFPSSVNGRQIGAWEIISNLPVRQEPQSGTFYIDVDGDPIECSFGTDANIWVEWVQSEYNEIGMDYDGDYLTVEGRYLYYDVNQENPVTVDDEITANTTYYLI